MAKTLRGALTEREGWVSLGIGVLSQNACGLPYREIGRRMGVSATRANQRAMTVGTWLTRDPDAAAYLLLVAEATSSATEGSQDA